MKKILFVFVLVAIIATGTAFAGNFSIGVHGGYGGIGGGGGVNFVLPGVPVYFYVDALGAGDHGMHISGAGDFLDLFGLGKTLQFYIRFGLGVGLWGFDDAFGCAVAARLPIGLAWKPIPLIEIFLQAIPQVGLRIAGSDSGGSGFGLSSNFWGGNLGIRLWL